MTRTVSGTISAAVAEEATQTAYLIRMGWATEVRIATWSANITWNSETWTASGARIEGIDQTGSRLILPLTDTFLGLVLSEGPLSRSIQIYEHYTTESAADATLLFTGVMDSSDIDQREINIALMEGPRNKGFPPTSIGPPDYNFLLAPGTRMFWGADILTIE